MPRVADIPRPEMPDSETVARLGSEARLAVPTALKGRGGWNTAQGELAKMASDILRGQSPHLRGNYSLRDKYSDRPTFSNAPYKTSVLYSSGRAGRRAIGRKV